MRNWRGGMWALTLKRTMAVARTGCDQGDAVGKAARLARDADHGGKAPVLSAQTFAPSGNKCSRAGLKCHGNTMAGSDISVKDGKM